jgi:hypothetical protein
MTQTMYVHMSISIKRKKRIDKRSKVKKSY